MEAGFIRFSSVVGKNKAFFFSLQAIAMGWNFRAPVCGAMATCCAVAFFVRVS